MVFCGRESAKRIRVAVWGLKGGVFRAVQARELFGRYGVPNAMGRVGQGRAGQGMAWQGMAWHGMAGQGRGNARTQKTRAMPGLV